MKDYLIAERYARGLSESLSDRESLEPMAEALAALGALYEESHDLRSVLSNPAIDVARRVDVLRQVCDGMGTPSVVFRLAELMVRRGRITLMANVAAIFSELADERLNRITARVTSAAPLDEPRRSRICEALRKHTDKQVRLDCREDKELLGGVHVQLGDRVYDGSLKTRLKNMKDALLAEG